jgi:signal transduction histidine kinase
MNQSVANDIASGTDKGSEYYIFYDLLKDTVNSQMAQNTNGEREKYFLHLTGEEYQDLRNQYLMSRDALIAEGVLSGHYEDWEGNEVKPDTADESDCTWVSAYNDRYTTSDGESISDYFSDDSDCMGIVNPNTGNWTVYGTFGLGVVASGTLYDWASQDVGVGKDFYFPADLLDYSSADQFAISILTTPFTTVANSMAYLSQTLTYDYAEEHYFTYQTLNQFDFWVEYETADSEGGTGSADIDEMQNDRYVITCDVANQTYDAQTKALLADGELTYDFVGRLSQIGGIKTVTIGIPEGIGMNPYGKSLVVAWCEIHSSQIYASASVSGLLSLILLVYLIVAQPSVCYRRDRYKLLVRTIVYGALGVAFGVLLAIYCDVVLNSSLRLDTPVLNRSLRLGSVAQILFIVTCGGVLYLLCYAVVMDYVLGIVRHVKAGDFLDNSIAVCVYRKVKIRVKGGFIEFCDRTKRFVADVRTHIPIAVRSVLYLICYLAGNVIWLGLVSVTLNTWHTIIATILFLLGLAVNVWIWHYVYRDMRAMGMIIDGITEIVEGDLSFQIDTTDMGGHKKTLAQLVNRVGEGLDKAVEQSTRDERLKAELITNVSHDIKTPLTSIINYVDLVKREGVTEEPLKGYIDVLDAKSMRLKQLIEDLVEASKASTGNIELTPVNLDMAELVSQTIGEFEDKFQDRNLELVTQIEDYALTVYADGRRCYRIVENLFQNIYKYAMPNTRVYLNMNHTNGNVELTLRNISEAPLKVDVEELTQRFVRGEESRTTEGSGLGLSIARSLTELQGGQFDITIDGDLFKVIVTFPLVEREVHS